jgi:phosphate transport system substrate-binding protein
VYKEQGNAAKGQALVDFLWWGIHDGQAFSESLHYAKLPPELVKLCEKKIRSITAEGKTLRIPSND